ncbi:MAG TPA: ATP-binding cassette domain-containing protein [Solirubrobacter sp.]|nr:ATP-binding cassette domain-containing protein [Solirubrobacter sp.]
MHPLAVEDLTKRYGSTTALDGLSFAVPKGSVCGFLGPNGAGKTTTLRILFGLAKPTAGSVHTERRIGGVLDRDGFHPGRTAHDELALAAARARRGDAGEALERAGLQAVADRRIGECSYGTRRRLALAAALLAEPEILLLDEPATGLDPHALRALRTRLREHAEVGGTVLLSSHVLEEVAATCDRVVVVNRGRRVADGVLSELLAQRIRLRSPEPEPLLRALRDRGLDASPDGPGTVIVAGADADAVGRAVRDSGAILHEMSTQGALEALYVGLTEAA